MATNKFTVTEKVNGIDVTIGNLPTAIVENNLTSLRDAIDAAMIL